MAEYMYMDLWCIVCVSWQWVLVVLMDGFSGYLERCFAWLLFIGILMLILVTFEGYGRMRIVLDLLFLLGFWFL